MNPDGVCRGGGLTPRREIPGWAGRRLMLFRCRAAPRRRRLQRLGATATTRVCLPRTGRPGTLVSRRNCRQPASDTVDSRLTERIHGEGLHGFGQTNDWVRHTPSPIGSVTETTRPPAAPPGRRTTTSPIQRSGRYQDGCRRATPCRLAGRVDRTWPWSLPPRRPSPSSPIRRHTRPATPPSPPNGPD